MKYDYKMRYIPMKEDIVFPEMISLPEEPGISGDILPATFEAAINAIHGMMSMTAMVFMKCMRDKEWDDENLM